MGGCLKYASLLVFVVLLVLGSAGIAFADNLSLGSGGCPGASISSGAATVSCTPFSGATTATYTETGDLATGVFGVSSFVTDTGGFGAGSGADVGADFQVTYSFAVAGAQSGVAQFAITSSGTLTSNTGTSNASFEYVGETGTLNGAALPPGGTPLASGISNIIINAPITNGIANLTFALVLTTDCAGVQQCTSSANFLDPTSITGAQAFDGSGNLISGATFLSQSGFNPNPSVVPTPEPASLVLIISGFLGLIITTKLKALLA